MDRTRSFALAAAALAVAAGAFLLLRPAGPPPVENGLYSADCCGTLEIADGRMVLNGKQSVGFQLGRDGKGPYLLPRTYYVGGLADRGFEVDGTRPVRKLRLDRLPRPGSILLPADGPDFLLTRDPPRPGRRS